MSFDVLKPTIIAIIESAGVAVIVIGGLAATTRFVAAWRQASFDSAYHGFRRNLGYAILLGLEFLVAADIINTVAVDPTMESVLVLGGIVLIRTFLSFSLEIEITGTVPWRRAQSESQTSR